MKRLVFVVAMSLLTMTRSWLLPVVQSPRQPTGFFAASRRAFLESAVVTTSALVANTAVVLALDDLSMPSAQEQKLSEEEAMKRRLALKAELQKKASQPVNFQDKLQVEKAKQEEFKKKSKEERRDELCEVLGRGC